MNERYHDYVYQSAVEGSRVAFQFQHRLAEAQAGDQLFAVRGCKPPRNGLPLEPHLSAVYRMLQGKKGSRREYGPRATVPFAFLSSIFLTSVNFTSNGLTLLSFVPRFLRGLVRLFDPSYIVGRGAAGAGSARPSPQELCFVAETLVEFPYEVRDGSKLPSQRVIF